MNRAVLSDRRERVDVRWHWSSLLVPGVLMLVIALVVLPLAAPGYPLAGYLLAGLVMAALLVGSMLVHEFAHVIVARRVRARVERISLGFGGGRTELAEQARTPRAEFLISAAGPAMSFGVAGVFLVVAAVGTVLWFALIVLVCLVFLAIINGVLAAMNLLPGPSTDGTQMLCAVLWRHGGDPAHAAAMVRRVRRVRRVLGGALFAAGLVLMFTTGVLSGLWLVGLAAFVASPGGKGG